MIGRKKVLSKNNKDEIIQYLKNGKTNPEIAKILKVSRSSVERFIKEFDLSEYKPKREIDWDSIKDQFLKMYNEGKKKTEIAKTLRLSITTIRYLEIKLGLTRGKSKATRYTKVCPTCGKTFITAKKDQIYCSRDCSLNKINWDDIKDQFLEMYNAGKSKSEISKVLKIAVSSVTNLEYTHKLTRKEPDPVEHIKTCPSCGKEFKAAEKDQIYCSTECALGATKKDPGKEELKKVLDDNDWNYSKTGLVFDVSDSAIRKWTKKYGIYKPKLQDWSDVVDVESAQNKINELGIRTASELNDNYGGLSDKLGRLGLRQFIEFPGTEFDSSWEERLFSLIEKNVTFSNLQHNVILSPDCKYIRPLVFDIVITYPDTSKTAIEVHGVTHFKPTYLSKNKSFEAVRERDNIKYTYCVEHNIPLYYFTYEKSLIDNYGYPRYIYTDETELLKVLKN